MLKLQVSVSISGKEEAKQAEQWEVGYIFPATELLSLFYLYKIINDIDPINRRVQQLLLYMRCLHLLSQTLDFSRAELKSKRLKPSTSVKTGEAIGGTILKLLKLLHHRSKVGYMVCPRQNLPYFQHYPIFKTIFM